MESSKKALSPASCASAGLHVYRASAGSGKTFRLAVEYLKLLVSNPTAYREILAVTFTNKATEEMKLRVMTHLYGLWRGNGGSRVYMERVSTELGISENIVGERARQALHLLLHDYGNMRIETIDRFFQRVLRNLARELELNANLAVTLNDKEAEQQAVDDMMDSLRSNSKELRWIMDYIGELMDEEKGWNITGQLKVFGENVLKDFYKDNREALHVLMADEQFFERYTKTLRALLGEAKELMQHAATIALKAIADEGLSEKDFANGRKGIYGYFVKLTEGKFTDHELKNATLEKALEDAASWVRKDDAKEGCPAYDLARRTLLPLLRESEQKRPQLLRQYRSAEVTLRHLSQLRLLRSIEETMNRGNREANKFMLSNTQTLLRALISDSDSPFIYEKIGARISHIMIDEFQDTSHAQWDNFKILMNECISHADAERNAGLAANLIVGDVKQSIYRWRGGDWQLLNHIDREFKGQRIQSAPLQDNRRSASNIIRFNNAFFKVAAELEEARLQEEVGQPASVVGEAYKEVEQHIVNDDGGRGEASIDLLPAEGYDEQTLERVGDIISRLLAAGHRPESIAIITRTNGDIQKAARHLAQTMPQVSFISDEAFRLDASAAVNIIIDAMRHIARPDDRLALVTLAVSSNPDNGEKTTNYFQPEQALPMTFMEEREQIRLLPLEDMAERIIQLFELDKREQETAYLCAFMDKLHDYVSDNASDLNAFISEWDNTLCGKTIHSDSLSGVRLITIHKSKGLEFENVIVPFCSWQLEKQTTIWCKPTEMPYAELPIIPVDFSASQMKDTIYETDYQREHLANTIDNLNLLYVAFTRAKKNLFIIGRRDKAGYRSQLIEEALDQIACQLAGSTLEGSGSDKKEAIHFSYGSMIEAGQEELQKKKEQDEYNPFSEPSLPLPVNFRSYSGRMNFRQSNKSRDFIGGEPTDNEQQQYIKTGNILHQLFSTIKTTDDIPTAILQLEQDGVLYDEHISRPSLIKLIRSRLSDPKVADWFSPRWQLYNECAILSVDPITGETKEHRPDRVMTNGEQLIVVDFKFGAPKDIYKDQVIRYMTLLRNMGHKNVGGYLWYVFPNRVEEVNSE